MTKVGMMKSIGIFLILVFATNAAFAFTARHTLENLAKIHHSGNKKTSNLISVDPDQDSDFNAALYPFRNHTKRQYNSITAVITISPILIPLINNDIIHIKTSQPFLNNLSDIFIPPKNRS